MKLKDIADMMDYLEDRCYCPYEIYDLSGFFFEWFYPETECELFTHFGESDDEKYYVVVKNESGKEEIINISVTDGRVNDCLRFDNTPHNREQIQKYKSGEIDHITIDEYPETNTQGELEKILIGTDFVCVS